MQVHGSNTQFFWLLLIAFVVGLAARRLRVPYALALVMSGLLLGALRLFPGLQLEPHLLFTVFLPPLLFEAALHLRLEALRRNWAPIAIYTLLGTVLSALLIGVIAAPLFHLPLLSALLFGALISATDPISVLAIFKRLGAGRRLTLIMEAESLFNDGVAVVLFSVFLAISLGGSPSLKNGLLLFAQLIVGGTLLGAAIGGAAILAHRNLDDHLVELTLSTLVAFGAYGAGESLHVSGVMAVVSAGLVLGNFGQGAMTPGTRLALVAFWEYAGFVVNSLIFLLIGIQVVALDWRSNALLAIGAALLVLVGRCAIYPLSWIVNRIGGQVPRSWQHVLVWGGLRGALSMALALGLPARFPGRETLVAATFGVVLFSLLVQGLSVGPLLQRLRLTGEDARGPQEEGRLKSELAATHAALAYLDELRRSEAYPRWIIETLAHDYNRRLSLLEATRDSSPSETSPDEAPRDGLHEEKQSAEVRILVLSAEKKSYQDAERHGLLDEEEWRRVSARIDAELFALRVKRAE